MHEDARPTPASLLHEQMGNDLVGKDSTSKCTPRTSLAFMARICSSPPNVFVIREIEVKLHNSACPSLKLDIIN